MKVELRGLDDSTAIGRQMGMSVDSKRRVVEMPTRSGKDWRAPLGPWWTEGSLRWPAGALT